MLSSGDPREIQPSTSSVVSRWKQLASTNRQSPEFDLLLSSLTAENNRSSTIELCGTDARDVLGVMDEVIGGDNIQSEHEHNTLNMMRRLAYNSGQVPARYQVDQRSLTVETDVIGSGAFTEVRRGVLDGKAVAIKTLGNVRNVDENRPQKIFCKESIIWMTFSHPNLLKLIGVDIDPQTGRCSMISEMMVNGNIREYIRKNTVNRHRLLKEVAEGLCYLHGRGIVHGDLKGNNILISNETPPRACLADFGLSTLAPGTSGATATNTAGGTPLYMAPELIAPSKFNNPDARPRKPADVYAFGMVVYEVLAGVLPFYERKWAYSDLMYHVTTGGRPTKPNGAEMIGFGNATWKLVEDCWVGEPTRRPEIKQVFEHLTRIVASSEDVGPTPETPDGNSQESKRTKSRAQLFHFTRSIFTRIATTTTNRTVSLLSTMTLTRTRVPSFVHSEKTSPPSILSQWQRLENYKSIDHHQLVPLVDDVKNSKAARRFEGKDAATVINVIDKFLKRFEGREKTKENALNVLRQLAGNTCQVPKSYLVGRWTRYTVKEEIIASGGFADVREGRLGDKVVAVKTLRTSKETKVHDVHKAFCKESVLWMNVSHPNILKLIAVDIKPRSKRFSMISEMMTNGNIMKYICAKRVDRLCLLRDVARGLEYLHGRGIVHGDMKGPNILINGQEPPQACISDFGLSIFVLGPTSHKIGGTPGYMAPEIRSGGKHSKEADIYAFGVVVYEVVVGFDASRKPTRPEDPVAAGLGQGTWEFIEECWYENPQRRPSAGEALKHFECVAATSTPVDPSPVDLWAQGSQSDTFSSCSESFDKCPSGPNIALVDPCPPFEIDPPTDVTRCRFNPWM